MADMTEIDKAIHAAKQRKAAKSGATAQDGSTEPTTATVKRPRLTDEEKAARTAAKAQEAAEKKGLRATEREARRAEKAANRPAAHVAKVEKARAKLPSLSVESQAIFNQVTVNFSADQIAAIASHLSFFNREHSTRRSLNAGIKTGDVVRIVSGDVRFVGKEGTVTKAQRIRAYVNIGTSKDIYVFTADLEQVNGAASKTA